ncbi:auxin efflux carrier [Pavlovales sp. CCMP2436]|nr:auxin efflux carrier [Pavlovales sp. CCMP2436]|mmetsp:Transcript_32827/g.81565  ORF Transcript_32827/g.81565 Transcript_32827/m.81565 type:complete len:439 (+) Transcript_32827:150-1466(+)
MTDGGFIVPTSVDALALLSTSAVAVCTVLFIMIAGALTAHWGYCSPSTIKAVNVLTLNLLLPCMLFSRVVESASIEALAVCWVLPAAALVNIMLGFAIASLFSRALRLRPGPARVFCMAGAFGNSQAFPMVVLTLVAEELLTNDPDATARAMAYIAYYLMCWTCVAWTFGWAFISAPLPPEGREAVREGAQAAARKNGSSELELARANVDSGTPAHELEQELDADLHTGTPSLSASLGARCAAVGSAAIRFGSKALSPPVIAMFCGIAFGLSPLKPLLVGPSAPLRLVHRALLLLGDITPPLSTLLAGASLIGAPSAAEGGAGARPPPAKSWLASLWPGPELVGVIAVRMAVLPITNWLLFLGARESLGLFNGIDPLIGFVVLLQGAMPSANNVVMMVTLSQSAELSQLAAKLMAAQVVVLPVVLVGWMTLFLATSYG